MRTLRCPCVVQESGIVGGKTLSVTAVQVDDVELAETDDDDHPNVFIRGVADIQTAVGDQWTAHKTWIIRVILIILLKLYIAYFIYAMIYGRLQDEGSIRLLWVTVTVVVIYVITVVANIDAVSDVIEKMRSKVAPHEKRISWSVNNCAHAYEIMAYCLIIFS